MKATSAAFACHHVFTHQQIGRPKFAKASAKASIEYAFSVRLESSCNCSGLNHIFP